MDYFHFTITFAASGSRPLTSSPGIAAYYVTIQPDSGNSNPIYVGGVSNTGQKEVSSSDYAVALPAPTGGGEVAPYPLDSWNKGVQIDLYDVVIAGTSGEKAHVGFWASMPSTSGFSTFV